MDGVNKQVSDFLAKCEEVKNCKFIMATTKIKDLLKSIVNSPELYELFSTVTANFDYISAKQKCLVEYPDGVVNRSYISLPQTVGERLAFIFCLLVEFDKDTINFNAFLQCFFPEDGSYYSSYHAFCDLIIGDLENIIADVFAKELEQQPEQIAVKSEEVAAEPVNENLSLISAIALLIAQEKQNILESAMSDDEKETGYKLLDQISKIVKQGDVQLLEALVIGYNYYVLCNNCVSESLQPLFEQIGEYISVLE